ncbi:hypothetical protein KKG48_02790 [Patescibacteria group bacterium]|nr:hypothetical protein [Patescibacteria group bacterium]MCG2695174.1 hypothetical protein [Candidatus Parcubacteria bacterium]
MKKYHYLKESIKTGELSVSQLLVMVGIVPDKEIEDCIKEFLKDKSISVNTLRIGLHQSNYKENVSCFVASLTKTLDQALEVLVKIPADKTVSVNILAKRIIEISEISK